MHRTLRVRLPQVHRIQQATLLARGSNGAATSYLSTCSRNSSSSTQDTPSQNVPQTPTLDVESVQISQSSETGKGLEVQDSAKENQSTSEGKKPRTKKGKKRLQDFELEPRKEGTYEFIQKEVVQTLDLDDLAKLRPAVEQLPDINEARYRKLYETVTKKVDRSFNQRQLFQLLRKMEPGPKAGAVAFSPTDKVDAIKRILHDHWDMPEPTGARSSKMITHGT